ncbi:hypothetical protein SAMN05216551_105293 [Chitinasiproducens palmae]|uniref:Uncharacterized protein n=1 Tax=Chitinasiproducens palmae TaxID=1770053 RepID=A0A1H2PPR5_9BURK|nr:hypothetical protein SAMN05216551_105293 [Chitinasiproducens palmae]
MTTGNAWPSVQRAERSATYFCSICRFFSSRRWHPQLLHTDRANSHSKRKLGMRRSHKAYQLLTYSHPRDTPVLRGCNFRRPSDCFRVVDVATVGEGFKHGETIRCRSRTLRAGWIEGSDIIVCWPVVQPSDRMNNVSNSDLGVFFGERLHRAELLIEIGHDVYQMRVKRSTRYIRSKPLLFSALMRFPKCGKESCHYSQESAYALRPTGSGRSFIPPKAHEEPDDACGGKNPDRQPKGGLGPRPTSPVGKSHMRKCVVGRSRNDIPPRTAPRGAWLKETYWRVRRIRHRVVTVSQQLPNRPLPRTINEWRME